MVHRHRAGGFSSWLMMWTSFCPRVQLNQSHRNKTKIPAGHRSGTTATAAGDGRRGGYMAVVVDGTCSPPLLPVPAWPSPPLLPSDAIVLLAADSPRKAVAVCHRRRDRLLHPPRLILTMITVIVLVHVCARGQAAAVTRARLEWTISAGQHEPWRALSYSLVHVDTKHVALNALVALAAGWVVEREQGWWRAAVLWAAGAAAGAAGASVLQPDQCVVGASAAVYALLTAHLPNVALRFGHIPLWWFRPLGVSVLVLSDVCWMLAGGLGDGTVPRVAWAAHAAGGAVGVPVAFILFTGEHSTRPIIIACQLMSAGLLAMAAVAAVVFAL